MEETIKQIMADILDLDPGQIDESAAMDNTEAWDSLAHINLCLAFEEEFQITLEVEEMESMISYFDITDVLQSKV